MILAVGNTKGGVGKTTVAINLAIARARTGRNVWLIDGDSHETALTAIRIRSDDKRVPGLVCSAYSEGKILWAHVNQQKDKFEDVIIDIGARDSSALRAALMLADVLLVPFQPRSFDVWALSDIASLINEVNEMRDGLRCLAMLNMVDPTNTADNIEAAEAVKDFPQLTYLPTGLHRCESFADAAGAGMCVFELDSSKEKDVKANDELKALYCEVFQESKQTIQQIMDNAPDGKKATRFMRGNKAQITLTIEETLLTQADVVAKRLGVSRSALINIALSQIFKTGLKLGGTEPQAN
jgi:chromosome partitioning protein